MAISQYASAADGKVTKSLNPTSTAFRGIVFGPRADLAVGQTCVVTGLRESGLSGRMISLLERGLDESQAFMQQRLGFDTRHAP